MTQEVRHTVRPRDDNTVLLAGEIAYLDSNTIKIGDGTKTFAQLPTFVSSNYMADNTTTSVNASNKMQALGTVNKNSSDSSTIVFDWIGTTQQYSDQQIATAHPDWLCFITDDVSGGSTSEMYTKAEIDSFLMSKADGQGSAVMTSGDQAIEGSKTFIDKNIRVKSTAIDYSQAPSTVNWIPMIGAYDKNNRRMGMLETAISPDGTISCYLNASTYINGEPHYTDAIGVNISQDGQTAHAFAKKPNSLYSNSNEIATTDHIMDVLKAIYPVGAIYIGTQSTCPMSAFFGTWSLVSSGRALWTGTGSNGNTTIAAGLPNITGTFRGGNAGSPAASGAFVVDGSGGGNGWDGTANMRTTWSFDASRSSSVYGNSSTVQPPAYVVNVWRRTA